MTRRFYQTLFFLFAGMSCILTAAAKESNDETNMEFKVRMSPVVNSYQRITAPVITLDGNRLYFDRKLHPENSGGIYDPDEIWYSDRTPRGYMTLPKRDTSGINTKFSDVLFSLSPDGRTALLYGLYDDNNKQKKQGYSISHLLGGKWSKPSPLNINDYYNYSDNFFAHLSADSRTLFLSAERFDSCGGLDLYVSFLDSLDNWSEPLNLGKQINTESTECSPYMAFDGKTLYFSSDRSGGHGALDLYVARRLDDSYLNWSVPENLGSNINSKFDENSICMTAMSDSAYIVSSDTFSLMTGIYQANIPQNQAPDLYKLVRGKVYVKLGDQKALSGNKTAISVKYEGIDDVRKYYAESGEYIFAIPNGVNALIRAEEHGFEDFVFSVNTEASGRPEFVDRDIIFHKELKFDTVLTTVFFESDSDRLSPEAEEKIYVALSQLDNIEILKFSVIGHADEAGTDEYNFDLSVRRGDNTAAYLKKLGIENDNIYFTGKGENQPLDSDRNKNRRVIIFIAK